MTDTPEGTHRVPSYYMTQLARRGNRFYTKDGKRLIVDMESPVGKLAVEKGDGFFMHWTNPPDGQERFFMATNDALIKWLQEAGLGPDEN